MTLGTLMVSVRSFSSLGSTSIMYSELAEFRMASGKSLTYCEDNTVRMPNLRCSRSWVSSMGKMKGTCLALCSSS